MGLTIGRVRQRPGRQPGAEGRARGLAGRIARVSGWPIHAYFLVLVLLFLSAAGAGAFFVRADSAREARRAALTDASFSASAAAKQLGTYVALLRQSAEQLAANPQITKAFDQSGGCTLTFSGLGGPDRGHIDVIAADGTVGCSSRKQAPGKTLPGYKGESWVRRALAGTMFASPVVDSATGAHVALTAVPIPGGRGIIASFGDLGAVGRELAAQYGGGRPVEFLVTSRDGTIVEARSLAADRWIGKSLRGTAFAEAGGSVEHSDLDGKRRLYASASVPGVAWKFYAGEDRSAVLASASRLERRQLEIILLGLLAFLLAASLVYLNLVRPLRRMRVALQTRNGGARPPRLPATGPSEIAGLAHDINGLVGAVRHELAERERAEELAQASERNYRMLFESNPHPMWVFDGATLRFLAVNDSAVREYGYSRDEFLSMTIEDIRPAEDVRLVQEAVLPAMGVGRGLSEPKVWRHSRRDGSIIEVEVTSHEHDFEGVPARVVLALNVTELRLSEARYRDLFENATDLIATTDLEGRLTNANRSFVEALGYSLDELLGKPLMELVPPESHQQLLDARAEKLSDARATVYEHELVAKDGSRIQIEVSSRLIEAHGRPVGVEAICRDVSDRRHLEDQLRQSQRLEAVGQLAGGIAHDFNNLLTVISGYTEVLLRSENHDLRRELTHIAGAAERAAALTRQLLAFSRRQVLQPRVIDLNEVVANLVPMLERVIGEDLRLRTVLDPSLHHVVADPGQVEQVLMNLTVNARDAMPTGGSLTIETGNAVLDEHYAMSHPGASVGPHAMLAVSDTGTGMDAVTRERVFEPFFTTKPIGSGTGLGLATVHGIVKQSGGNVWVYSEPGNGTTFKIFLPAVSADVPDEPGEGAPSVIAAGTETVLVVEDEPSLRNLVGEILELQGYEVLIAESPIEALEIAAATPGIDLLLTDLIMPHFNGRELAEQVTRLLPSAGILFMSGYADEAVTRNGALELGGAYLEKPFSAAELGQKVRAILDARTVGSSLQRA